MTETVITPAAIRFAAMNLLARREHSEKELLQKLSKKFPEGAGIEQIVAKLKADGLQSDERFAAAFVAMRKRQGKGKLVISMELRQRGIADDLASDYLTSEDENWQQLAVQARQKKFGPDLPGNPKERARQIRFLASRGFSSSSIQYALNYRDDYID